MTNETIDKIVEDAAKKLCVYCRGEIPMDARGRHVFKSLSECEPNEHSDRRPEITDWIRCQADELRPIIREAIVKAALTIRAAALRDALAELQRHNPGWIDRELRRMAAEEEARAKGTT